MKREIKFRFWDLRNNDMKTPLTLKQLAQFQVLPLDILTWDEELLPMQYTGLEDKNGKEIYEGDKDKSGGVVMYNEEKALFALHVYYDALKKWSPLSYPIDASNIEIIGNIHENPELL